MFNISVLSNMSFHNDEIWPEYAQMNELYCLKRKFVSNEQNW